MLLQRTCQQCNSQFSGGPRAYYCPSCRAERQRKQSAAYQRRKRAGNIRPLGSIDKCTRCGKQYTVEGGQQRFCPECQPVHTQEYDRETSLEYYHEHKARINPVRNERRRYQRLLKKRKNIKKIDIAGGKFGRLTAIKEVESRGKNRMYLFRCECGKEIITQMSAVKWGNTRSCGCLHSERVSAANLDDLTGQTFGKLTVLERAPTRGKSLSARWICRCECGNFSEVQATNLKSGRTKSCGCSRSKNRKRCKADGCDIKFLPTNPYQLYCSDRCRYRQNKRDAVAQRIAEGKCPQCGGDWIEPQGKSKYCRNCQEYWRKHYKKQ